MKEKESEEAYKKGIETLETLLDDGEESAQILNDIKACCNYGMQMIDLQEYINSRTLQVLDLMKWFYATAERFLK